MGVKYLLLIIGLVLFSSLVSAANVAYWNFNENSGNIAYDSSGFNNNGILLNNPMWINGVFGSALHFDGIDDYILVNDSNSLDINYITIDAWIKVNNVSGDSIADLIIGKDQQYVLGIGDTVFPGHLIFSFGGMPGANCHPSGWCDGGVISFNEWHHVVLWFNGTTIRTYIDNNLASEWQKTFTITNTTNNLGIGAGPQVGGGAGGFFNGDMDEVRINNQPISLLNINMPDEANLGSSVNITLSDLTGSNLYYIVAFSSSTSSGFTVNGKYISLTPNGIFLGSVFYPDLFGFQNSQSFLINGEGQATWTVPSIPFIAYFTLYFAAVTIDINTQEVVQVSNVEAITMLP